MRISHYVYAFSKSKFIIQKIGFFVLVAAFFVSCKKELPITESSSMETLTNTKSPTSKTNGIPNGGFTLDAGGQGSGVNSNTGLSPLTQLFAYKTDASGNVIVPHIIIPTNYYLGDIYGQEFFVTIGTYQIYPSTVLGTPVEANMIWLNGSDIGRSQSLVNDGSNAASTLNDGKFAFSYSLLSSYTAHPSTQLLIPDPAYNGFTTAGGSQPTMFNPNFLENIGGGSQVVYDSARIVCDGKGGFAFTEVNWNPPTNPPAPAGTVLVGIAIQNGYSIKMYAPDPQSPISSNNQLPVSSVQVRDSNNNDITLTVRRITVNYYGDINDATYLIGSITLIGDTQININSTWIAP